MADIRCALYSLMNKWEDIHQSDILECFPYSTSLDELLFNAGMFFNDYKPFLDDVLEGEFPARFYRWLNNVGSSSQKQALFKIALRINYINGSHMMSLYRDAFRRIIEKWLAFEYLSAEEHYNTDYHSMIIELLKQFHLFSITESFVFADFLRINQLVAIKKPINLEESSERFLRKLDEIRNIGKGIIFFEDFVGSGIQAQKILRAACTNSPDEWHILFVPLILLEKGYKRISSDSILSRLIVKPVLTIGNRECVAKKFVGDEPYDNMALRSIIYNTSSRVCRKYNKYDVRITNPFGFFSCGSLLVTCHNAPDNTLPLIHHRAPKWAPLFRRHHNSRDGLR